MVVECVDRFMDFVLEFFSCVFRLRVGYCELVDGYMIVFQLKLMELMRILNELLDIECLVGGWWDMDQVLVLDCIVF